MTFEDFLKQQNELEQGIIPPDTYYNEGRTVLCYRIPGDHYFDQDGKYLFQGPDRITACREVRDYPDYYAPDSGLPPLYGAPRGVPLPTPR